MESRPNVGSGRMRRPPAGWSPSSKLAPHWSDLFVDDLYWDRLRESDKCSKDTRSTRCFMDSRFSWGYHMVSLDWQPARWDEGKYRIICTRRAQWIIWQYIEQVTIVYVDSLVPKDIYIEGTPFRYFRSFSEWSKRWLPIEYPVHIWQMSPQLSCNDICPIWMWSKVTGTFS